MGMDWGPHEAREQRSPQKAVLHSAGGPLRPYEQRAFTVGNVVGEALELDRRFFLYFSAIAAAVFLVTNLVSALGTIPASDMTTSVIVLTGILVSIVGFFAVQGALTITADDVRDGRVDLGVSELVRRTAKRLPDLACAGFLIGLVLIGGAVAVWETTSAAGVRWLGGTLIVVGALFLLTRWAVVTPVIVLEGCGPIVGLRRSWRLVHGHTGRALLIILITGLIALVATAILRAIVTAFLTGFLDMWLTSVATNTLATPFLALSWTLMYFHLREPALQPAP